MIKEVFESISEKMQSDFEKVTKLLSHPNVQRKRCQRSNPERCQPSKLSAGRKRIYSAIPGQTYDRKPWRLAKWHFS